MSLKSPNYYSSKDTKLYNELMSKKYEDLTEEEQDFCKSYYHQEEYACGLDG